MTTAFAFSGLVWLLSFAVALYYLVRLQEWRVGVVAAGVAVVALAELATLTGSGAPRTTIGGASAAEVTAVVISVITLFAVFVFATTLQRAQRADKLANADSPTDGHTARVSSTSGEGSVGEGAPEIALPSDDHLQEFIDTVPDALITIDENGVVERASQAVQRIFGYTADELIGKNVKVLMPEPFAGEHDGYLSAFRETGISKILGAGPRDVVGRKKDGSAIPLELAIGETRIDGRRIFVGALRDISKRAEALRQSEDQFSKAFNVNPNAMAITRASDGKVLAVNDKTLSLLGLNREEYVGQFADSVWETPGDRAVFLRQLQETGLVEDFEFTLVAKNGNRVRGMLTATYMDFDGTKAVLTNTRDITRQKQAEDYLQKSEEQFSKAFHANPNAMVITRASDGKVLAVNDKTLSLVKYDREEYIGQLASDIWEHPEERALFLRRLQETGLVENFEFDFVDKDGGRHTGVLTGSYLEFDGVKAVLSNTRDITEQKQTEKHLQQSEDQFSKAFNVNPNAMGITRASDGKVLAVNDKTLSVLGYRREEYVGTLAAGIWEIPDERAKFLRQLQEHGLVEDFEFSFMDKGGNRHTGLLTGSYMEFDGTKAVLTNTRDVTRQKQAEENLRQSEEKFSKAFLMSPDGLVIVRASDGVTLEINERFLHLTGRAREEVLGLSSYKFDTWVRPEDRETLRRELEEKGEITDLETIFRRKSGEHLTVLISSRYIDLEGERCILSIIRDVTESRSAERELAQNREMLQALLDAVPLGINVKNRERRYIFMNPFQAKVYGAAPERAIGKTPSEFVNAEYGASIEERDRQVFESGNALAYFEEITSNARGESRNWLTTKLLLGEKDSPDSQVLSISLDMTERKATEDQLRHAQKMEAVGHLTGGVAHDFNNLLTALLGSLQLLSDRLDGDELAERYIDICLRAVNRGADLTQRLLAFSRKQALSPRPTDIGALIGGMTDLLQRTLGAPVEIRTTLPEGLWPAMVDEAQLESAILNLTINARDAMPAGGKLSIAASNADLDGQTVDDEEVAPGSYVQITVRDTGAGIPGEILSQVFEPFFTTKEIGKGSGLGLSMVYGFVKQSGGHVEIESEVGRGTTVKLYLPRAAALSEIASDAVKSEGKLNGDESILIVEDDPDVRAFDIVILERLGYTVRSANDGLAALSMADAMPDLDLLLTDVLLPGGMSGKVIADRVIKRSPGTKVLFVSGFPESPGAFGHTSGDGAELLPKPYSKDDLARKVREVLDSDGGAPAISTGSEPT